MDNANSPRGVRSPFETTDDLRDRLVNAVLAQAGFNHEGLNAFLRAHLSSPSRDEGGLVAEPVLEGAAAYEAGDPSLEDLRGNLLRPETIDALTYGNPCDDYRFEPALKPYRHQIEAWQHLTSEETRSVLVTSGTGSGKTECFLVPLLDDLVREADGQNEQRPSGVRAIMLYPLNALIASQEERLRRWTKPFRGQVRFGLYNGMTPETLREFDRKDVSKLHPEQVFDRKTLRNDPPEILVTNVTMLEYLTIRKADQPLVDRSQGKLRWIIIDEAHSYVGSAAAEIALLLRRVMQTFGVVAGDVRFVATSATIGDNSDESRAALRTFLAELAGVSESQVFVVEGRRASVVLPKLGSPNKLMFPATADQVASNRYVQDFIRSVEKQPVTVARARELLKPAADSPDKIIEAIAGQQNGKSILPLRVHHFMRAVPGLWSCLNPKCTGAKPNGWAFGSIAFERSEKCGCCGSPLFEVVACRDCGEPYLQAYDHGSLLSPLSTPPDEDEFAAASDSEDSSDEDPNDDLQENGNAGHRRLMAARRHEALGNLTVDPTTGELLDHRGNGIEIGITPLIWDGSCPICHARSRDAEGSIRPFRFGAPFLIGNVAPVALEGVAPKNQQNGLLPADGRQLLSFTDSRQGTARFAANIETGAERAYVRGYVYHLVQKASVNDREKLEELDRTRRELEELEKAAASNPALSGFARDQRAKYEGLISGKDAGVSWSEVQKRLSQDPVVNNWIRSVWKDRDERFAQSPEAFANFVLLRELARRPRRANSLETLGLAQLRFPHIDQIRETSMPHSLRARRRTIEEWRDFLYWLIDVPVRSYFALDVSNADVRWLLSRGGIRRNIVGPGEAKGAKSDLVWPQARPIGPRSNAVLWLERLLDMDSSEPDQRAEINDILATAWRTLRPLFENVGSQFSLNLAKAVIAPLTSAWLCPVTRRVLAHRVFGYTPYGHRENSPFTKIHPAELKFPPLPIVFPRSQAELDDLRAWIDADPMVDQLRTKGVWRDIHDRAALLSPFIRAEEHSAQQPPERLRAFEQEFRRGEINMLACSTTMEMGVDIGAVSAVLMTNVPPSIANYRQRVGRAGRRGQGFASSFTLSRDTPLDRETFREPETYLVRSLRPPQVSLDAPRIVQRHVNALLLARWFVQLEGQLLKIQSGAFFGLPASSDLPIVEPAPVDEFCDWLRAPTVREEMRASVTQLVRGTALSGNLLLFEEAIDAFSRVAEGFRIQWQALADEANGADSDAAKKSVQFQLRRLAGEHLLKELANRSLLPGHGFPTAVVPFVNDNRDTRIGQSSEERESTPMRRYDYPARNADIAIREYAPGAEVVIDGLVWRSAGVTLNWRRPAYEEEAREVQSLRNFWSCMDCGAADSDLSRVFECPVCGSQRLRNSRYLQPAGFRVDWNEPSHAETDRVKFVEAEAPQISVRDATWEPLLDPALGRARTNTDGLVYYSSLGSNHLGYRICLECGRAEEEPGDGSNPLSDHHMLRGRSKDEDPYCPGNQRTFAVTEPIALGHEIRTDVAEFQPTNLHEAGAAWALASAIREALARRLGIEFSELGLGVEPRKGRLDQETHSIFLFDRNAGGAGFATRLLDDAPSLLNEAQKILDCTVPGCEKGCASCVLAPDLFKQQEIVDRKAALLCVEELLAGMKEPEAVDVAVPDARLSPPIADALVQRMAHGTMTTIFASDASDLSSLDNEPFTGLFSAASRSSASVRLAIDAKAFDQLDDAQRMMLRDYKLRYNLEIATTEAEVAPNRAQLIATLNDSKTAWGWYSRDDSAGTLSDRWGVGTTAPVVYGPLRQQLDARHVDKDDLLPRATTAIREVEDSGRSLRLFGGWFASQVESMLDPIGAWQANELIGLIYSDRYLRSPLSVALALRALAGLRDALAGKGAETPLNLVSSPLNTRSQGSTPVLIFHDWQLEAQRQLVVEAIAKSYSFSTTIDFSGASHARKLTLHYRDGRVATVYLDQGFGYWQASGRERFDFRVDGIQQAAALLAASPFVAGRGKTYFAATTGRTRS